MDDTTGKVEEVAIKYLAIKGVAARLGKGSETVKKYDLPEPDALIETTSPIGATRAWLPETIDRWWDERHVRGYLTKPTTTARPDVACSVCEGAGQIIAAFGKGATQVAKPCPACGGTGIAPAPRRRRSRAIAEDES